MLNDATQIILPADGIHNDNKRSRLHQYTYHHLFQSTKTQYHFLLYYATILNVIEHHIKCVCGYIVS